MFLNKLIYFDIGWVTYLQYNILFGTHVLTFCTHSYYELWITSRSKSTPTTHHFTIFTSPYYFFLSKSSSFGYNIEFETRHGIELEIFVWRLGWLYLDDLKGVIDECKNPMYQFWWWILIIHGRNWRLHVCFDMVNNGPTYKIVSE